MEKELPYVVSDLDGTLVSVGYDMKPDTINDILKYQKASGHKFTIATGRSDLMCWPFVEWCDVQLPVISCNGALIRDPKTKEVLHADYLDKEVAVECYKKAAKLGLDIAGYDEDSVIVLETSNEYINWSKTNEEIKKPEWQVPFKVYPNFDAIINDIESGKLHLLKMMIDCNRVHKEKEALSVFEAHSEELNFTWSGNNYLDAMKKGISKATGLVHLAKILKVDLKDIVCFGDNYNDIAMIDEVDKGYAVGNAVQPLKDVAYKVTDTLDNNGVGKILLEMVNEK